MGKIIQNYNLQQIIGQGVYAVVYKAINIKTNQLVAVKVIKAAKFKQIPKLQQFTVNQINTLSSIQSNQHIVKYLDMLKTTNNFYFVYQYCNGGTLQKQIKHYKTTKSLVMPEFKAIYYFKQIINAFKTLTKYNIMHRDLKPDNILLHNGIIKLADFGFCKTLRNAQDLTQTMLGSPIYMAPQVLKGQQYTIKADIWSLGVVLYQMLFGECPFKSNSIAKLIQIFQKDQIYYPRNINPSLQYLLSRMLVKDRHKRIDWNQIFQYRIEGLQVESPLKNYSVTTSSSSKTALSFTTKSSSSGSSGNYSKTNPSINDIKIQEYKVYEQNMIKKEYCKPEQYGFVLKMKEEQSKICRKKDNMNDMKLGRYLLSHQKISEVINLGIQSLKRQIKQSIVISYFLCKSAQKDLQQIKQNLEIDISKQKNPRQSTKYNDFKNVIQKQFDTLQLHLKIHKQQIQKNYQKYQANSLFFNKNKFLKSYITTLKITPQIKNQNLIHASQLLDYFQEAVIIKRDIYHNLTLDQLNKRIQNKLLKLV